MTYEEEGDTLITPEGIKALNSAEAVAGAVMELQDNNRYTQAQKNDYMPIIRAQARRLGCLDMVVALTGRPWLDGADRDARGNLRSTIDNYCRIISGDPWFANLRFNEMKNAPETIENGLPRMWTGTDDNRALRYIERNYNLSSRTKYGPALDIVSHERMYNPIKAIIEREPWDGRERIRHFLHKWMDAEDTPYTREVSRLIFAGGIHRLYNPGVKFDCVPVLCGRQDGGKSSLVRFLAIDDDYFCTLDTIQGKEGKENVAGAWIVEIPELKAFRNASQNEIKAFITGQRDKYRHAYDKYNSDDKRMCIFIATTNDRQFITDKTGGRRFFPVDCHKAGYILVQQQEQQCRNYILQCWREAYHYFSSSDPDQRNKAVPYPDISLQPAIHNEQQAAMAEDFRDGIISQFLQDTHDDYVCVLMIWDHCFADTYKRPAPDKREQMIISQIMQNMPGWDTCQTRITFEKYGRQRCWVRHATRPKSVDK